MKLKRKWNLTCWAVLSKATGKLSFYDGIPKIYKFRRDAQENSTVWNDDEIVKKVKFTIERVE